MPKLNSKMRSMGMRGKHHKGPLREVREVIRYGENLFDHDSVIFACGHTGHKTIGATRGRCRQCALPEAEKK